MRPRQIMLGNGATDHWRSHLDLPGADLRGANLTGADLTDANLAGVDLRFARLERADLTKARLINTKLMGARLHQAHLNGADLAGAVLGPSEYPLKFLALGETYFDGARLEMTDLRGVSLKNARGLMRTGQICHR